jgi:hypothetical protein
MKTHAIVAIGLFAITHHASAQQLYRCGNTYSQTPCAADAASKSVYSGSAPARAPGLSGYELCAAHAVKYVASPEPESARTMPVGQRKTEVIRYAGQSVAAHRFDLTVDAKTTYGVYSGPVTYSCWLSEDQARMLQFRRGSGG